MKKGMIIMALVVAFVFALMVGSSQAALISGKIWVGTGYGFGTHDLTNGASIWGTSSSATFTVDAINFTTESTDGTYTGFLSSGASNNLVWADAASATFGGTTFQTDSATASFVQLTGTAIFPQSFSIRYDDGLVLYVGNQVFDFSAPTAPAIANINLASAGTYNFTLNYAGWNGFPEVLQLRGDVRPVPIPPTAYLIASGLIPFIRLRKKRSIFLGGV